MERLQPHRINIRNPIILFLGILVTIIFVIISFRLVNQKLKTQSVVLAPSIAPYPSSLYLSGTEVDKVKFAFNYPNDWKVSIEKIDGDPDSKLYLKRFTFNVTPPNTPLRKDQKSWGQFWIDVLPKQNSIEDWFDYFLSEPRNFDSKDMIKRSYYAYSMVPIGNKDSYYIAPSDHAPDGVKYVFMSRYIVLGKYYTYQILGAFGQGEESQLFSGLSFQ